MANSGHRISKEDKNRCDRIYDKFLEARDVYYEQSPDASYDGLKGSKALRRAEIDAEHYKDQLSRWPCKNVKPFYNTHVKSMIPNAGGGRTRRQSKRRRTQKPKRRL